MDLRNSKKYILKSLKEHGSTIIIGISIIIDCFIIYFMNWNLLGSFLIVEVTCWGLIYNIEYNRTEKEKERESLRKFLAIEIRSTTSNLENFMTNKIESDELQTENTIKLWYKFSNQLIKVFKMDELELLNEFLKNIKKINSLSNKKDPIWFNQGKLFMSTILISEKILKEVFDEEDKLELNKNKISMTEFNDIINFKDLKSLERHVLELNKQGKLKNLLKKSKKNALHNS